MRHGGDSGSIGSNALSAWGTLKSMPTHLIRALCSISLALVATQVLAQTMRPATTQATDKLPLVHVDVAAREVSVECEAVIAEDPLEFLCVTPGIAEHETVLRTQARPSHIHLGLIMIGLTPGEPMRYVREQNRLLPPRGPVLRISARFERDGKAITVLATDLMRNRKTHKPMPARNWVFAGSRMLKNGDYGADTTAQVISIVNFDYSMVDVPEIVSSSDPTLEYEVNPETVPPKGAKVMLILRPAE